MMKIQLRFFASVREKLGISEQTVEVPAQVKTVADVRAWLCARDALWAEVLATDKPLRMACNLQMCEPDTLISEACEVAFFPPVTGG
jgi:molybdopterin synthase sulfur carrier subunit